MSEMSEPAINPSLPRSVIVWAILSAIGMAIISAYLYREYGWQQVGLWWIAAGLGLTFFRSGYGFTRAWRNLVTGESTLGVRAHLLMMALASVLLFPLFRYGIGDQPVYDIMRPVGLMMLTGAFIFGIGMQIAGSCTSGSMYRAGSGQIRLFLSLIGIVFGAFWASKHYGYWQDKPTYFVYSYQRAFPLPMAIAIQLGIFALLYLGLRWFEKARHGSVSAIFSNPDHASMAQVRDATLSTSSRSFWWGRWSLGTGSILIAVLGFLAAVLLSRPWVVSLAFPMWSAKIADQLGFDYDFPFWDYWGIPQNEPMLDMGLLEDPTSLMNIAFIVGAFIGSHTLWQASKAERMTINVKDTLYRPAITLLGGVLMGYGAIIGLGCNIGGFVAAVLSGSVHGWAWVGAALIGTVIGVFLRKLLRI